MGLYRDGVAFLATARRLGVDFEPTLMLGRQTLLVEHTRMRAGLADAGLAISDAEARRLVTESEGYGESLLRQLGALRTDSIDVSNYENCTIVHNLNDPLPAQLRQRYGLVLDGGTLEHVFDYPSAIRNALDAVRVGGHFAAITPVNGYAGHGFYQLSPELFYRVLSPTNGFRMVCALLKPLHWRSHWRLVPDPEAVGGRVIWRGAWPTLLHVLAQRTEAVPLLEQPPLQSDYLAVWERSPAVGARLRGGWKAEIKARIPLSIRELRESRMTWQSTKTSLRAVRLTEV
jgi:hypothetical protein